MDGSGNNRPDGESSPQHAQPPEPEQGRGKDGGSESRAAREKELSQAHSVGWYAAWTTIVGVPLGILVAVVIALSSNGDASLVSAVPSRKPRLERIDLIARNGLPPHKPSLELLVHNGGRGTSVVSRARIEIMHLYPLPLCFTQGELPVSAHYGLQLPADAEPGEAFEVPIHQQIEADQADRFTIGLGVGSADPGNDQLDGLYLFEVEVSLVHDGEVPALPMGRALISLDRLPFTTEYLLREGQFPEVVQEYKGYLGYVSPRKTWATQMPCWQKNAQSIIRAGKSDATRSRQLQTILDTVAVPSFSEVEP